MATTVTIAETPVEVTVDETAITANITESTATVTVDTGVTDHGALTGLSDDDHTQYLLKAGGTMTGDLVLAGDPDAALKAATKQYVDAQAGGGGASDVDGLTTDTGNAGEMVRVDGAGTGLEYRTTAQVLADIGAAASGHNHDSDYVDVTGDTMTGALTITGQDFPLVATNAGQSYISYTNTGAGPEWLFGVHADGSFRVRTDANSQIFVIDLDAPNNALHIFSGGVAFGSSTLPEGALYAGGVIANNSYISQRAINGVLSRVYSGADTGKRWWWELDGNSDYRLVRNSSSWAAGPIRIHVDYDGPTILGDLQSTTAAIYDVAAIRMRSSGTPAAGFGAGLLYQLESSTTDDRSAARIAAVWQTATDASRKADLVMSAYDTGEREFLRGRGNGSAAAIGFLGATPQTAPTYTPTNVTTDRSFDADTANVNEVADVLGTLIADLQAFGLLA